MIRRPPRTTLDRSSAASDVYKRQVLDGKRDWITAPFSQGINLSAGFAVEAWVKLNSDADQTILAIQPELGAETAQTAAAATVALKAVSYTHLRAHETVLDLVCRLLLEKKNQSD